MIIIVFVGIERPPRQIREEGLRNIEILEEFRKMRYQLLETAQSEPAMDEGQIPCATVALPEVVNVNRKMPGTSLVRIRSPTV